MDGEHVNSSSLQEQMLALIGEVCSRLSAITDGITHFFFEEKFLVPFLSTLVASVTVLLVNRINARSNRQRKKIYATTYMADSFQRALHSNLIIKVHTILPHLEAIQKIIDGDNGLLYDMIINDDVDVLQDKAFRFMSLPDEYKVLVANDDVELVQIWDALNYLQDTAQEKKHFGSQELSTFDGFMSLDHRRRNDILDARRKFLERRLHEADRTIDHIRRFYPRLQEYMKNWQFIFYQKKSFWKKMIDIDEILQAYKRDLPPAELLEQRRLSGIKKAL